LIQAGHDVGEGKQGSLAAATLIEDVGNQSENVPAGNDSEKSGKSRQLMKAIQLEYKQ
jgi:hypothetical protein